MIFNDVIGFGSAGLGGWFVYQQSSTDSPRRELSPTSAILRSESTTSQLRVAPRFEVLLTPHVSLGAELVFQRMSIRSRSIDTGYMSEDEMDSYALTAVPMLGLRLPLPRGLSIWGHAGFGGGVASMKSDLSTFALNTAEPAEREEVLLTRLRADARLGYEPIPGLMLTLGPELTHATQSNNPRQLAARATTVALFGGVSFVIR